VNPQEMFDLTFSRWTAGLSPEKAVLSIFEKIREIPYAVIPELNDTVRYINILRYGKGSCMPKHLLLGRMCERLGFPVLYSVYPFRWDQKNINYPPPVRRLAEKLPVSRHLACRININNDYVLVDSTLDTGLEKAGLPVNKSWDGASNTLLPVMPTGDEEIYHSSETSLSRHEVPDQIHMEFYTILNHWLNEVRLF
jgi:hypothetical protein